LSEFLKNYGMEVWAYCLMPNHVHLVKVPGENDQLVRVKPMTDPVDNWSAYLSDVSEVNELSELISLHARTGRPLGDEPFVAMLEKVTGRDLLPKRPGRPAADRKK
jgi:hypothetical protein